VVDWIVGRADLLSFFFVLLTLLLYLKYQDSRKSGWLIFSWLLFLAGLFSKESAIVLLLLLPLVDLFLGGV